MKYSKYQNLELGKDTVKEVTDEDINLELNTVVEKLSSFIVTNDKSQIGDKVNIDFEGFVDNNSFEGGKAEKFDLILGSGTFIPGFEDQLVGKSANDLIDVKVTFPKDYHSENVKGKDAIFKCKINEIKRKVSPSLDDDLALREGFKNLEEMRKFYANTLKNRYRMEMINSYITKICNYLAENSELNIGSNDLENRINEIIKFYEQSIAQYGVSLDSYLSMSNMTLDKFKESLKDEAEKSLKIDMIYEYIAIQENITINDNELENYLVNIKKYYNFNDEQIAQLRNEKKDELKKELVREKVSQFLFEKNN